MTKASVIILLFLLVLQSGCTWMPWLEKDIHIALAAPMSGPQSSVGKSFVHGVRLYLDDINRKGGIKGKKIVLDVFDDINNPATAKEKAIEIVNANRAVAVIGHYYSSCSIVAGEIYKKYGVPAISPASTNVKVTLNNPWYFRSSYNDNLQGRFLANYAKTVFRSNNVSIIHEDYEYGSYLAKVFAQTADEIGLNVKYTWGYSLDAEELDTKLIRIVNSLSEKKDAGVIFMASHAKEGIRLVQLMKDAGIRNTILAPDSFASESFQNAFSKYPKEQKIPGFYTNDIHVTTPLIFDTTNEKGLKFKESFKDKYEYEPGWHAAFAYDTAKVLVETIRQSGVSGRKADIRQDRKRIQSRLSGLTSFYDAIEGVTGFNYFDEKGDSRKPVFIGVYKNGQLISALTQFRYVPNINEVPNFESAVQDGRIVYFDNQYSYKINVVYTGIELNAIDELDMENLTAKMDFYMWFRYQGEIDTRNIEFTNAVEPISLVAPVHETTKNQMTYCLYHITGKFRVDFRPSLHSFGQHLIGVSFRPRGMDRNNLIFVKDILGMRLSSNRTMLDKLKNTQVLPTTSGWKINQVWFFQDIAEKSSLGNPDLFNVRGGTLEYSRFNVALRISEDRFSVRRVITNPVINTPMMFVSLLLSLLLAFSVNKYPPRPLPHLKENAKTLWFFQIILIFLFLITLEVYIINRFSDQLTDYYYQGIVRVFDVLWWMTAAFMLTVGAERFIWRPLEEKTQRSIPRIIRNFFSIFIYLIAAMIIVAFVFDQKLTSLLATSGVIAMIIGLAIQINIANIFSGIAINLERPFRIGDWVQIGNFKEGKVVDINWRSTRIQSRDGSVLCIPNNQASESPIENFSYPDEGYFKYFTIHVDPIHPPERVKKVLLDAALSTEGVLDEPPPGTRFLGLTAGMTGQSESWAANYLISVYVSDYGKKFAHNEAIWLSVWTHLRYAGIRHVMERQEVHLLFQGMQKHIGEKITTPLSILQELDIFDPFSDEAKADLSRRMRHRFYAPGDMIVRQGDAGDSLFIIVEGTLGVWTRLDNGESIEVARLGAGNFFGEMALLTGEPRTATIIAITESRIYEITKEDIIPLIEKQPEISWALSEVLSERRMMTEFQKHKRDEVEEDKTRLSTQILAKIQNFFGFKK